MTILSSEEINNRFHKLIAKQANFSIQKKRLIRDISKLNEDIKIDKECEDILKNSIKAMHSIFKVEIEKVITNAIQKVFNRDLTFELIYEEKRNSVNTRIVIKEEGEILEPEDDLGGSILEIISFSFRIIMWQMSANKSRSTFILDEPFNWTGKLAQITGLILKELSNKFKFQVILITHNDDLIEIADKIFKVDYINGASKVKVIRKRRKWQKM